MSFKKILLIGFIFALLVIASLLRPMNYDEAYYVESARLLLNGYLPYTDFHFHMMPLLLIIYAPLSSYGFWSFIALKFVSIVFVFLSYFFYSRSLVQNKADKSSVLLFVTLFFLNSFYLDWSLTLKIYSVSAFLVAGYVIYFSKYLSGNNNNRDLYICSIFVISLFLLKHSFAGNLVIFICFEFFILKKSNPERYIKPFLISLALMLLPVLLFLFFCIGRFDKLYFDLVNSNIIMQGHNHPFTLSKVFLPFLVPQNLILITIILFSGFKYSLFEKFIFFNIVVFILVHAVTSIIPEYYSTFIPLLIFLAVLRFDKFMYTINSRVPALSAVLIKRLVIFVYVLTIPFGISSLKYIFEERPLAVNAFEMYELRKIIEGIPGASILSSWEGYSIYSTKNPLMTECYVSSFLREYMSDDEMIRHNISTYNDFRKLIQNKIPDIIVYDTINPAHLKDMQRLIENSYIKEAEYKFIIIYKKS